MDADIDTIARKMAAYTPGFTGMSMKTFRIVLRGFPELSIDFLVRTLRCFACFGENRSLHSKELSSHKESSLSRKAPYTARNNFKDTVNPMCPTNDGVEDTEHFLLLCPSFDIQRQDLLASISVVLRPFAKSTVFLTVFYCNFYCMVIKTFPMMLTNMYSNLL